jgi:hypothetical protein
MKSQIVGICLGLGLLLEPMALVSVGLFPAPAAPKAVQKFSTTQESVGRIKLNMSLAQVSKILGKPRQKGPITVNNCAGDYNGEWKYNGLDIIFSADKANGQDGKVSSVAVSSPRYLTNRGIKVGDKIAKVEKIYGQKFISSEQRDGGQLMLDDGSGCFLAFFSNKQGRVSAIQLHCLLC